MSDKKECSGEMIPANINKTMKAEIFNIIPMSLDFMFFIFSS